MIRFASLAVLAALVAAAPSAASPAWQSTPDGVVVTPSGGQAHKVRLQVMSDRIVHVTAVPGNSFDLPASLMVVAKPAAT